MCVYYLMNRKTHDLDVASSKWHYRNIISSIHLSVYSHPSIRIHLYNLYILIPIQRNKSHLLSNRSRGTLISCTDRYVQRRFKSNTTLVKWMKWNGSHVTAPSVQIQYCSRHWVDGLPLHSCTWPGQLWRDRQVHGLWCILQAQQLQANHI